MKDSNINIINLSKYFYSKRMVFYIAIILFEDDTFNTKGYDDICSAYNYIGKQFNYGYIKACFNCSQCYDLSGELGL